MPEYEEHVRFGFKFALLLTVGVVVLNLAGFFIGKFAYENLMTAVDAIFIKWYMYPLLAFVLFFYSILPDMDTPASKARFIISVVSLLAILTTTTLTILQHYEFFSVLSFLTLQIIIISITSLNIIMWFLKHRGIAHGIVIGAILSAPLIYFHWLIALFGFMAYTSHLILDHELSLF